MPSQHDDLQVTTLGEKIVIVIAVLFFVALMIVGVLFIAQSIPSDAPFHVASMLHGAGKSRT